MGQETGIYAGARRALAQVPYRKYYLVQRAEAAWGGWQPRPRGGGYFSLASICASQISSLFLDLVAFAQVFGGTVPNTLKQASEFVMGVFWEVSMIPQRYGIGLVKPPPTLPCIVNGSAFLARNIDQSRFGHRGPR